MNDHATDNMRLVDYALDEMPPAERAAFEVEMVENPKLNEEANRLLATATMVDEAVQLHPSPDFDERLRRKLDAERAATFRQPRHRHLRLRSLRRWALPAIAAGLVVAMASLWPRVAPEGSVASVAWGEVVRAVGRIEYCHATAIVKDSQDSNPEERMFRIDLHYLAPDRVRIEGLNHVQFVKGDALRLYDAGKREFADLDKERFRLMPTRFLGELRKGDLLGAVLSTVFRGDPPDAMPVRSDAVATSAGIEVFDYARDARRQWARIWVLKETRLPMRIRMFHPDRNETMLVTFDYSERQPARYFDPDHFEEVVKAKGLTHPEQILRVGAETIADKPTNRGQVFEMQEQLGFEAPKILKALGNADGGIMIVYNGVRNVSPEGRNLITHAFEEPRDNWGNVYFSTGAYTPLGGSTTKGYLPVPPFRQGAGERIVTFQYAVELHQLSPAHPRHYETKNTVLSSEDLRVGFDDADAVLEGARERYWGPDAQRMVREWGLKQSASALRQWQHIQAQLSSREQDVALLAWAYGLLKEHERAEKARKLAGEKLLPAFLQDPLEHSAGAYVVREYLQWLYQERGIKPLEPIISRLRQVHVSAGGDRRSEAIAKQLFEGPYADLGWLLELPEAERAFRNRPARPVLEEAVKDPGRGVALQVSLPPAPDGGLRRADDYWSPSCMAQKALYTLVRYDRQTGIWSCRVDYAKGPVTIEFEPLLVGRPEMGERCVRARFALPVDLSKVETVDSIRDWWDDRFPSRNASTRSHFSALSRNASVALFDGRWAEAVALYQELLDLPKDQWPEYIFSSANAHLDLYERNRSRYRHNMLKAQLRLGELKEVLTEIERIESKLLPLDPSSDDFVAMRNAIRRRAEVRSVRLEAVRYLVDRDRLSNASEMLGQIAAGRPNPLAFPDRNVMLWFGKAGSVQGSSFAPRKALRSAWQEFDTVQWDMADKLADSQSLGTGQDSGAI